MKSTTPATSVATLVPALSVHEHRAYALTRELARRVQTTEVIAAVSLLMMRREQALRDRVERAESALCVRLECSPEELALGFELGDDDDHAKGDSS